MVADISGKTVRTVFNLSHWSFLQISNKTTLHARSIQYDTDSLKRPRGITAKTNLTKHWNLKNMSRKNTSPSSRLAELCPFHAEVKQFFVVTAMEICNNWCLHAARNENKVHRLFETFGPFFTCFPKERLVFGIIVNIFQKEVGFSLANFEHCRFDSFESFCARQHALSFRIETVVKHTCQFRSETEHAFLQMSVYYVRFGNFHSRRCKRGCFGFDRLFMTFENIWSQMF